MSYLSNLEMTVSSICFSQKISRIIWLHGYKDQALFLVFDVLTINVF